MTTFTIEVPEETVTALCRAYGYDEQGSETEIEFAQEQVARYLKEVTVAADYNQKVKAVQRIPEPPITVRTNLVEGGGRK